MAAAACGPRGFPRTNSAKPHKEHLRKSRDSRRRQAALLFLTNISLDGRPVYNLSNGIAGPREAESRCVDVGAAVTVTGLPLSTTSSYGTFTQVSSSISGGAATPQPRTNTYPAPLSPLPAFNQGSCDVFTEDGRTDPLSVQAPPLSPTSVPVNPLLGSSKSPGQFPGSNPVPDPRQRWVLRNYELWEITPFITIWSKCVMQPSFVKVLSVISNSKYYVYESYMFIPKSYQGFDFMDWRFIWPVVYQCLHSIMTSEAVLQTVRYNTRN